MFFKMCKEIIKHFGQRLITHTLQSDLRSNWVCHHVDSCRVRYPLPSVTKITTNKLVFNLVFVLLFCLPNCSFYFFIYLFFPFDRTLEEDSFLFIQDSFYIFRDPRFIVGKNSDLFFGITESNTAKHCILFPNEIFARFVNILFLMLHYGTTPKYQ